MEIMFYVVGILILGFAAWRIYLISNKGTIDSTAWAEIRVIGYETIDELVKLYNAKEDKDEFIDFILNEVADKVNDSENLSTADKAFWNYDNLSAIFKPVISNLVDKIIEKTNK